MLKAARTLLREQREDSANTEAAGARCPRVDLSKEIRTPGSATEARAAFEFLPEVIVASALLHEGQFVVLTDFNSNVVHIFDSHGNTIGPDNAEMKAETATVLRFQIDIAENIPQVPSTYGAPTETVPPPSAKHDSLIGDVLRWVGRPADAAEVQTVRHLIADWLLSDGGNTWWLERFGKSLAP